MIQMITFLENYLPEAVYKSICHYHNDQSSQITEIRLRLGKYSTVTKGNQNIILKDVQNGELIILNGRDMQLCFNKICEGSLYKFEKEIKLGYITLPNGCRVGFCGTRSESGYIRDISSINIRITGYVTDAAKDILPLVLHDGQVISTLIVSPPCGGKTTILTDLSEKLCRQKLRVSIVDERGEIAAVHQGIPQKNVGKLCDVLDNYPKGEGMMIALRCLSPQVIMCDEIGAQEDVNAMMQALNGGVPVIASAHASSLDSLLRRPQIKYLIDNGAIERIILLQGPAQPGRVNKIVSVKELYEICRNHSDR